MTEKITSKQENRIAVFASAIFLGTFVYMLAVPQTSGMHVYFQYYFAIPVALGLVLLLDFISHTFFKISPFKAWSVLLLVVFLTTSALSVYHYNRFFSFYTWGDASDVQLLKSLRDLPPGATVVASEQHPVLTLWFQNPNIEYYSGRKITAYVLEDSVPAADYQVVPSRFVEDIVKEINSSSGYGQGVLASKMRCSTNYCLIQLTENTK